ncbi:hypothetical protein [Pseudochryseolinea flava]|nr:hypothetical protein [Pseudochryseolinea flava]
MEIGDRARTPLEAFLYRERKTPDTIFLSQPILEGFKRAIAFTDN